MSITFHLLSFHFVTRNLYTNVNARILIWDFGFTNGCLGEIFLFRKPNTSQNPYIIVSRAHIQQLSKAEFSPFIITQYRIWYRWCYKKANNQLVTKQNETKHKNNNPRQHWRSAQTLAQRWPNVGTVVPTLAQRWPNHQRRLGYHWEQYFKRQLIN